MKNLLVKIKSAISVAWGRMPVIWIWKKPKDDLATVLQVASRHYNPKWNNEKLRSLSQFLYFFMLVLWPIKAIAIINSKFRLHAARTREINGISYRRQLTDLFKIAFLHWTNPEVYYLFELHTNNCVNHARNYLLENTMTAVMGYLNNGKSDSHIENKHRFSQDMARKGIQVVVDIGVIEKGRILDTNGKQLALPEIELIVKPALGLEGKGVLKITPLGNDQFHCSEGSNYSKQELEMFLRRLSEKEDFVIQPKLINHPAIRDLSGDSFCTYRIITGMTPDGDVQPVLAVMKMPIGSSVADNFGAGGIASPIDLKTGILGTAVFKKTFSTYFDKHPESNAQIKGRALPFWQETLELARTAHKHVDGGFVFLGWDIGVCENGPIIVETQVTFGFILCERPGFRGIGSTKFPHIYAQWVKK